MLNIFKSKNVVIGLMIVLSLLAYFLLWGSKWNDSDFTIGEWASIWTLDNSSDNSTSIDTLVENVTNEDIQQNITNMTDEEKQNTILRKTLENNEEINSIRNLYSNKSSLTDEEIKKFNRD